MTTNDNFSVESAPCPRCHMRHPAAAECVRPATSTSGPLLAQAESLFESYLAARLVRARRNLTSAKVALLRDPRSREKRDALLRAEAETEKLQAQLLEQVRRATLAREQARNAARPDSPAAVPATPSPQPTDDFRSLQAVKADISVLANATDASSTNQKSPAERALSDTEQAATRASKFTE